MMQLARNYLSLLFVVGSIIAVGLTVGYVSNYNQLGIKSVMAASDDCSEPWLEPDGHGGCEYRCDPETHVWNENKGKDGGCETCDDGKVPSVEEKPRNSRCVDQCKMCQKAKKKLDENLKTLEKAQSTFEDAHEAISEAWVKRLEFAKWGVSSIPTAKKNARESGGGVVEAGKRLNRADKENKLDVPSPPKIDSYKNEVIKLGNKTSKLHEAGEYENANQKLGELVDVLGEAIEKASTDPDCSHYCEEN